MRALDRSRMDVRRAQRAVIACFVGIVAFVAFRRTASANGRFISSQYFVAGPGADPDLLALQTTFGVVLSTDRGMTWRAECEDAIGFSGEFDPSLAIARNGNLIVGLPDGLSVSPPGYCGFSRPPTAPGLQVIDVANDGGGDRIVAAASRPGLANTSVYISDDGGNTWRAGWSTTAFFASTIEIAPGEPSRLYLSGALPLLGPVLYRSDDGGMNFVERTREFHGGHDAFISAVDPTRADTVYVRSNLGSGPGTLLLRSDDAGGSFREITRTESPMTGFAISDDGRKLWVGGTRPTEAVSRSVDGGESWTRMPARFVTLCMRYHAGTLYVCGDQVDDDFALACSTDDGESFATLLRYDDIRGPDSCASGSSVHDRCAAAWSATHALLTADSGRTPAPRGCHAGFDSDGCRDASVDDVADLDAEGRSDTAQNDLQGGDGSGLSNGCACRTPLHAPGDAVPAGALMTCTAGATLRRRRRFR